MEASTSSSSSSNSHPPLPTTHSTSKATLQPFDIEEVESQVPPFSRWPPLVARIWSRLPPPVLKAILWLRGPRPKIDLPDPKPLLDIDFQLRGHRVALPIERTYLRLTRSLIRGVTRYRLLWILLRVLVVGYIISLAFFAKVQFFDTPPQDFISCTSTFWLAENGCGLDGSGCAPFNGSSLDFRCPAGCSGVILENPRTVGDDETAFVPLIVGGGDSNRTYRGDSFICAAAIQAGLVTNRRGGCGTLDLTGNFTDFLPFEAHGLSSIGFPTVFPLSFRFRDETSLRHCEDLRDDALIFNAFVTAFLFLLRLKPIVLFWCLVCIGYWHIVLFSQPQGPPPPLDVAFGTFLPALFICYAFWRLAYRFCLPAFRKAPIEAMVLYLLPYWVGILAGQTTDRLPLERLTSSDLHKRSGAVATLVVIVLIIGAVAINQLRVFRKDRLAALLPCLLPTLNLRIHHYFLAIVLMPGTALPTRVSALAQGYLLGLFLNGAAAYGLASILQTNADLVQDATLGTDLATFITNSTNFNGSIPFANQTISWNPPPPGWDGFALLVDDVERYLGSALNFSLAAFNPSIPHFIRLALTADGSTGDFTHAASLYPNGSWIDPAPGAT
ncbi:LCCL domain-containing protein [Mycena chlorophos]|uniref:LCCL domain-containing protein n=1 Tax=Mycena chlorophos TaxID=658473 RepID=A0A8H6T4C3_MYCCL|nr:LCCL domain-containing protein [Mycena chlorophos]